MATVILGLSFFPVFLLKWFFLENTDELATWRNASMVVVLVAALVFLVQFFGHRFFDPVFEICIFYVPAFVSVILYLLQRRRLRVSASLRS